MAEASDPAAPQRADGASPASTQPLPEVTDTPPSFPKKPKGRPPGRPNKTVKESDYESNTLVQRWNAARLQKPITAIAINIREALPESFLNRDHQREIYKLPSVEYIHFVQGWITSRQVASQRPSYVNGLLIHSRGADSSTSCNQCVEKRGKNALGPFISCRVLPGYFHNSCSNCKWFDNTSACSLYNGPKPNRKRKAKDAQATADVVGNSSQDVSQKIAAITPTPPESGEIAAEISPARERDVDASMDASVVDVGISHTNGDDHNSQQRIAAPDDSDLEV